MHREASFGVRVSGFRAPREHRSPGRAGVSPGSTRYGAPRGVPGTPLCGTTFRLRGAIHTMALPGNPRGKEFQCTSSGSEGGRRRDIGAVAVLSATPARPRRWCDAGPPQADQKAGAPGSRVARNIPHKPAPPTVSRTRDPNRFETDGQAGRPPPQYGPDGRGSWKPGHAEHLPRTGTSHCLSDARIRPLRD